MITEFDALYAGHVDMENIGYTGQPVNDRWFSNEHLTTAFDKTQAIAQLMDRLPFDTLWLAEHHFQREGYECIPNILLLSVHLANLTNNLKFGCGFNITPMWHPLRLAEDFAMADILTKGRVKFGLGRGYHTREVEVFGSPLRDQVANRELFEEQVNIIFKAFNQESFSHKGDVYTIPPEVPYRGYELKEITLVPRPINRPVECWQPIQSATPRGLDFMAKHGISGIIGGGSSEGGAMIKAIEGFRDAYSRSGTELALGERLSIGFHYHIAASREKAIEQVGKYYEENVKMFGPLRLVRSLSDAQIEIMGDPKLAPYADLPRVEDSVKAGGVLAGTSEMITDQLKELEDKYQGLERVSVSHPVGTPQTVIIEQLQQFAEEVMPHFKVPSIA